MVGVLTQTLAVADGPLTADNGGLLRASEPSLPLEELRKRYDKDSYLFLKGILPREDVLEARR
ncbi:Phytanoyl-CoA dioxygenase PhyH, partial [Aspergillus sclerotialis]